MDDISQLDFVNDHPRDLALHLEDEEGPFSIECLIFESTAQGIRALFKHGSFELADRLSRFIARQNKQLNNIVIDGSSLCRASIFIFIILFESE